MFIKYLILLIFFYRSNVKGADLSQLYISPEYPAPYLQWIQRIQNMPEMQWLNHIPHANEIHSSRKNNLINLHRARPDCVHYFKNYQPMIQNPEPRYQNTWYPPQSGYYPNRNLFHQNISQLKNLHNCMNLQSAQNMKPVPIFSHGMMVNIKQAPTRLSTNYRRKSSINQHEYQHSLISNQNLQPMFCIPMKLGQGLASLEPAAIQDGDDEDERDEDDIKENVHQSTSHEKEINETISPISHIDQNLNTHETIPPISHVDQHLNTHETITPISHVDQHLNPQPSPLNQPKIEQVHSENHDNKQPLLHKDKIHKKKRHRKRRRGLRINKKIGRTLLKGVHVAEDVAASGALGPQFKAAAIAAKTAETMVNGAIKGESAAQIMKESAMTAASSAVGGSMKAQMMGGLAAQAGLPVPPTVAGGGASPDGPLGAIGGGNLKQQLIHQAEQQALNVALNEASKHAGSGQPNQTVSGPTIVGMPLQNSQQFT